MRIVGCRGDYATISRGVQLRGFIHNSDADYARCSDRLEFSVNCITHADASGSHIPPIRANFHPASTAIDHVEFRPLGDLAVQRPAADAKQRRCFRPVAAGLHQGFPQEAFFIVLNRIRIGRRRREHRRRRRGFAMKPKAPDIPLFDAMCPAGPLRV